MKHRTLKILTCAFLHLLFGAVFCFCVLECKHTDGGISNSEYVGLLFMAALVEFLSIVPPFGVDILNYLLKE